MRQVFATVTAALCILCMTFGRADAAPYNDPGDFAAFSFAGSGVVSGVPLNPASSLEIITSSQIFGGSEEFGSLDGSTPVFLSNSTFDQSIGLANSGISFRADFDRTAVIDPAGPLGTETGFLTFTLGETTIAAQNQSDFYLAGLLTVTASNFYDSPVQGSWVFEGFGSDIFDYQFSVSVPTAPIGVVPLPAGLPLLVGGVGLLGWFARRKKKLS